MRSAKRKNRIALALAACAIFVGNASIHRATAAGTHHPEVICVEGIERFLPGDYYFCEATRLFQDGKVDATIDMLRESARWANKKAQFTLGMMYWNGDHVTANRPLGLAWLALSAERHNAEYEGAYTNAYLQAAAEEKQQANSLYLTMKSNYGDAVAARRAVHQFDSTMHDIEMLNGYTLSDKLYIAGLPEGAANNSLQQIQQLKDAESDDFHDLHGSVTVGALQKSAAPAASSSSATTQP